MADLLKFKHGLQANMTENSPALTPGTVYITRDERAMYVDLPAYTNADGSVTEAAKRIRIGDMRVYTYISDLRDELRNDMSTLTTSALFYAEKDKDTEGNDITINALLKWDGTKFIQLNKTSDLAANLDSLEGRISAVEDVNATQNTNITNLTNNVNTLKGDANTKGSVAHSIAAAVTELNAAIALKADASALDTLSGTVSALSKTVSDNATAASTAHIGLQNAIDGEASRAKAEEERLAGLISGNAAEIGKKANSADVYTIENTNKAIADAVKVETDARAQALTTINGSITTINGEIESIKNKNNKQDTAINGKVNIAQDAPKSVMVTDADGNVTTGAAVADKLGYLANVTEDINGKFTSLGTSISNNADEISSVKTTVTGHGTTLGEHGEDIEQLKSDLSTLKGSGTGSVAEQIAAAVDAEKQAREEADQTHTSNIATNAQNIGTNTNDIAGLKTDVSNIKNDYLKKTDAPGYGDILTKAAASDLYATKGEREQGDAALLGTSSDPATANTIYGAHAHAKDAADAADGALTAAKGAQTTANNNKTAFESYVTTNNAAVAGVKATADAAAKATDLAVEVKRAGDAEKALEEAIVGEATARTNAVNGLDERLDTIEVFFAAAQPGASEELVDTLAELQAYIASDKSGAAAMTASIKQNADDIASLEGRMGEAEGNIKTVTDNLTAEITNRTNAVSGAIETANAYTDSQLEWGQF